ncbi:MAG TPA: hypothetical protein DEB39_01600 [Planctomycetaceae bacterium]|nr:hypothetical protein [Planctomycetaceae bacterium]
MSESGFLSSPLYPLRFTPIYKDHPWGGRRFETLLKRRLSFEGNVAESWDICDHEHGESVVVNGPLRGTSLNQLVQTKSSGMFGHELRNCEEHYLRFPMMLKYLDAREPSPVQVHPDTSLCRETGLNDFGKTKAWVVVDAAPQSRYYAGFKERYPRERVAEAVRNGTLPELLNPVEAHVGDCVLLKPGTVHALGEGVMVAEVQTTGNATFCLFDWDRCDAGGNPEGNPGMPPVDQGFDVRGFDVRGLDAIDYTLGPVFSQRPRTTGKPDNETLLICDDFRLERWTCKTQFLWYGNEHCHLWTVLEGSATAIFTAGRRTTPFYESGRENDPDAIEELERGDSILVPAMTRSIRWIAENNEPIVLLVALLP